jgi:hypothetical protein
MILKKLTGLFSFGDDGVATVPSMDGALKPNQTLQAAAELLTLDAPDNLMRGYDSVLVTSGPRLLSFVPGESAVQELRRFPSKVTAAAMAPDGTIAVGLQTGSVLILGADKATDRSITGFGTQAQLCPTALGVARNGDFLVTFGSTRNGPDDWRRDLMEGGATGSVWRLSPRDGSVSCLASGLAWPAGVIEDAKRGVVVAEAWKHRLVAVGKATKPFVILDDLPCYPGRIAVMAGGYALSLFAPRLPMVEFILREPAFKARMMAEIAERYWMAPSLSSGHDFKEPLLGGAVKQLGILKPWAPTRSYGLVVRTDADFQPVESYHSRGDGTRHGITSAIEFGGALLFSSSGGNMIGAIAGNENLGVAAQ